MRLYYSMSQNLLAFNTPHDGLFLVFDVSNVKYLTFRTFDGNALKSQVLKPKSFFHLNWVKEDEDEDGPMNELPNPIVYLYMRFKKGQCLHIIQFLNWNVSWSPDFGCVEQVVCTKPHPSPFSNATT